MMKVRYLKSLFLLFHTLIGFLGADAAGFKVDDIWYYPNGSSVSVDHVYSTDVYYGNIVIPSTVTYEGVTYTVTSIGNSAFSHCKYVKSITLPNTITSIDQHALEYCKITSIAIPSSVKTIGSSAFLGCGSLERVDISDLNAWLSIDFSGYHANPLSNNDASLFLNGQEIQNLVIPNNVSKIKPYAFGGLGFKSVTIAGSVTTVGDAAFRDCSGLKTLTIGNSVSSIGGMAFNNCKDLTTISVFAKDPPELGSYCFAEKCYDNAIVHVPATALNAYKTNRYWRRFHHFVGDVEQPQISLSVIINSLNLVLGEQYKLEAYIEPTNVNCGGIAWKTTNPAVATVNKGIVTAVGAGECDIIAHCLDKQGLCHVVVKDKTVIAFDQKEVKVSKGQKVILTLSAIPTMPDLVVYSSEPTIAEAKLVNGKVKVSGIKEGVSKITVSSVDGRAIPAACSVTVHSVSGDVNHDNNILNGSKNDKSVTPKTGKINNHEYVDLGLSVKWATKNVGAVSCADVGSFFAWGEIAPKNQYDWPTYQFCESRATYMTKYNYSSIGGNKDGKRILEEINDAATQNMGQGWRMPTSKEVNELIENCTWTWCNDYNGSNTCGYLIRSNVPGYTNNSIFLPAGGYRGGTDYADSNQTGSYWTLSLDFESYCNIKAYHLFFDGGAPSIRSYNRFLGMNVRGVVGERPNGNVPFFVGDIGVQRTGSSYVFTIKLLGGGLSDYGWEFSFDEDFSETINARNLPSTAIDIVSNNTLRLVISKNSMLENGLMDARIRAYAKNAYGIGYSE